MLDGRVVVVVDGAVVVVVVAGGWVVVVGGGSVVVVVGDSVVVVVGGSVVGGSVVGGSDRVVDWGTVVSVAGSVAVVGGPVVTVDVVDGGTGGRTETTLPGRVDGGRLSPRASSSGAVSVAPSTEGGRPPAARAIRPSSSAPDQSPTSRRRRAGAVLGRIEKRDGFLLVLVEGDRDSGGRSPRAGRPGCADRWCGRRRRRRRDRRRPPGAPPDVVLDGGVVAIQILPDPGPVLGPGTHRAPGW